jgi:hypothetical protein
LYTRDKLRCVAHFKRKGAKSREEATVSSWRKAMKSARRWTLTSRCSAWSAPTENSADASASIQRSIFCSFSPGRSALLITEPARGQEGRTETRHASTLQRLAQESLPPFVWRRVPAVLLPAAVGSLTHRPNVRGQYHRSSDTHEGTVVKSLFIKFCSNKSHPFIKNKRLKTI